MITRTTTLLEAREAHRQHGGILLVEADGYAVCHGCPVDRSCFCRPTHWVDSLAPSWDETAPENARRDDREIPTQGELL
jgi:hypothetical protein